MTEIVTTALAHVFSGGVSEKVALLSHLFHGGESSSDASREVELPQLVYQSGSSSESSRTSIGASNIPLDTRRRPTWSGLAITAVAASAILSAPGLTAGLPWLSSPPTSTTSSIRIITSESLRSASARRALESLREVSLSQARRIAASVLFENEARRSLLAEVEGRRAEALLGSLDDL